MLNVEQLFKYHPPKSGQRERYEAIRATFLNVARFVRDNTPASAEQTLSIRALHLAMMHANSAIAINEDPLV
jgi:hypothetical protein